MLDNDLMLWAGPGFVIGTGRYGCSMTFIVMKNRIIVLCDIMSLSSIDVYPSDHALRPLILLVWALNNISSGVSDENDISEQFCYETSGDIDICGRK